MRDAAGRGRAAVWVVTEPLWVLIDELLGQINDVIGGLDAIMFNKYTRVPEKLRAWQSASHVERAPQREKKPTTPPTPPPA